MPDKDIVERARELLADSGMEPFLFGVTRDVFRALVDEVERLRNVIQTMNDDARGDAWERDLYD